MSKDNKVDELLKVFGTSIAELHKKHQATHKREKLEWSVFDARCKYEEKQAKAALFKLISEEVIGDGCRWCDYKGYSESPDSGDKYADLEKIPCDCQDVIEEQMKALERLFGDEQY